MKTSVIYEHSQKNCIFSYALELHGKIWMLLDDDDKQNQRSDQNDVHFNIIEQ